jgi:hypothetical protein
MRFYRLYVLMTCFIIFSSRVNGQKNDANDAKKVIENAIVALGGSEYLGSIKTVYSEFSTEIDGRQVHCIIKEMLPNKGSFQIIYKGKIVFHNWYNGEKGFEVVNGKKRDADIKEFKDKEYKKNIFDELDYLDSSLWKIELLGEEKVKDEDCYKVRATLVNGLVKMLYYSKSKFYLIREDTIENAEKDRADTIELSGYQKFGQLTHFTTMKLLKGGQTQTGKIVRFVTNQLVTNADFR